MQYAHLRSYDGGARARSSVDGLSLKLERLGNLGKYHEVQQCRILSENSLIVSIHPVYSTQLLYTVYSIISEQSLIVSIHPVYSIHCIVYS